MSTEVKVTWLPDKGYLHQLTARSHELFADATKNNKGLDQAATPHELFLLGLAACTAMTVEMFAASKGWPLKAVSVTVCETSVVDPDEAGKQIPHIGETLEIEGELSAEQLSKLQDIAKRCPVYKLFVGKKVVDCRLKQLSSQTPVPESMGQSKVDDSTAGDTSKS